MSTKVITAEQANTLREECDKAINMAKALDNLLVNPDFKKVFTEGYTKDEASRLVGLLGEPNFNMSADRQKIRMEIKESLIGIARFSEYCRKIKSMADQATKSLEDLANAEVE